MGKATRILITVCLSLLPLLFEGCEGSEWFLISPAYSLVSGGGGGSGNSGPAPVGPHVGGRWSGEYRNDDTGESISLTAEIDQEGNQIFITTSKTGVGHYLSGTIDQDGYIRVTDAYDGQIWTSGGTITSTSLTIDDYTHRPTIDNDPALQLIVLSR